MRLISTLCLLLSFSIAWSQAPPVISFTSGVVRCGIKKILTAELIQNKPVLLEYELTGKVAGLNVQSTTKGVSGNQKIIMRCSRVVTDNCSPVLIIDGVVRKLDTLSKINPNNILSFSIIKSGAATAFWTRWVNGAVIVKLKQSSIRKFYVKDLLDESGIAGATVLFISEKNNDTLMFAANDSGIVVTDKLESSSIYEMRVSAIGYHSFCQRFNNGRGYMEQNILLNREVKNCEEVILSQMICLKRRNIGCTLFCKCSGITLTMNPDVNKEVLPEPFKLKIYPSPVHKGGVIKLQFKIDRVEERTARIVNLNGVELLRRKWQTNKGNNQFQLSIDARWAGGIYLVQLLCENGRILASEKIIIQ
ncbi:MAG: T9SS type A sorting domain-containing protein [Chitinophagaceae bacterium]|nr:T9SS type A sorting domain-containing protein [Chitinophagaceae bacterium]